MRRTDEHVQRHVEENWKKYMNKNPLYFRMVFPKLDVEGAWTEVNRTKPRRSSERLKSKS